MIVLDWALTGTLSLEDRRRVARLLLAMTFRDAAGVEAAINALSREPAAPVIGRCVREFFNALPHACSLGPTDAMRLLDTIGLEGVRFPPSLILIRKVLFTLDGVLHDIAGDSVRLNAVVARDFIRRWIAGRGALPAPFTVDDYLAVQHSMLRYVSGAWAIA